MPLLAQDRVAERLVFFLVGKISHFHHIVTWYVLQKILDMESKTDM